MAITLNRSRRWSDILGPTDSGAASSAMVYEAISDTGFRIPWFKHNDANDYLQMVLQFDHRRATGTLIHDIHMHLYIPENAADNTHDQVAFKVKYCWVPIGSAFPANFAAWTAVDTETDLSPLVISTTTAARTHQYYEIVHSVAAPASDTQSSLFFVRINRKTTVAQNYNVSKADGGTAACNVGVLSCDSHFLVTRDGSQQETSE